MFVDKITHWLFNLQIFKNRSSFYICRPSSSIVFIFRSCNNKEINFEKNVFITFKAFFLFLHYIQYKYIHYIHTLHTYYIRTQGNLNFHLKNFQNCFIILQLIQASKNLRYYLASHSDYIRHTNKVPGRNLYIK